MAPHNLSMNYLELFSSNYLDSNDKESIFLSILRGQAATRSEVVKLLSIRSTTVSDYVNDMLNNQLLTEVSGPRIGRGRPSLILIANPNKLVSIVFQLISQSIHVFCVNIVGNIVQHEQIEVLASSNNNDITEKFRELYKRIRNKISKQSQIAGIVFSLSGLLDINARRWLYSSRLPLLNDLSLKNIFPTQKALIFLSRTLDDELRMRLLNQEESTLLVHWGYGVSIAFGTHSNNISSVGMAFGEIGHWKIANHKVPCHCGQIGCLETLTALWSIGPKILGKNFLSCKDEDIVGNIFQTKELIELPEIQLAIKHMVLATSNICRVFFPKRVIVTGPFVRNPQLWSTFCNLFYKENVFFDQRVSSELLMGESSRDLSAIGASAPALQVGLQYLLNQSK